MFKRISKPNLEDHIYVNGCGLVYMESKK